MLKAEEIPEPLSKLAAEVNKRLMTDYERRMWVCSGYFVEIDSASCWIYTFTGRVCQVTAGVAEDLKALAIARWENLVKSQPDTPPEQVLMDDSYLESIRDRSNS